MLFVDAICLHSASSCQLASTAHQFMVRGFFWVGSPEMNFTWSNVKSICQVTDTEKLFSSTIRISQYRVKVFGSECFIVTHVVPCMQFSAVLFWHSKTATVAYSLPSRSLPWMLAANTDFDVVPSDDVNMPHPMMMYFPLVPGSCGSAR